MESKPVTHTLSVDLNGLDKIIKIKRLWTHFLYFPFIQTVLLESWTWMGKDKFFSLCCLKIVYHFFIKIFTRKNLQEDGHNLKRQLCIDCVSLFNNRCWKRNSLKLKVSLERIFFPETYSRLSLIRKRLRRSLD